MTAAELTKAERSYRAAHARAEKARAHRNDLVCQALAADWTHQKIADATGLTRGRINQIRAMCSDQMTGNEAP